MKLALKIDVDTYRGIEVGASRLAGYLRAEKIPASFFVTMGPDTSGWAATRVFKHRGFMKKMRRTSALSIYGWRTVLSGTLWPARPMALSFSDLLRQWRDWGFEVSPHGYDHIRWHDQAAAWDRTAAGAELERAWEVYRKIFRSDPECFAAPGWQAGWGSWKAMEDLHLLYHSDSRGVAPYFPQGAEAETLKTLEIPTTLPTWDEMLAWENISPENVVEKTWALLSRESLNVWTIHAEFEGGALFKQFRQFVDRAKSELTEWTSLPYVARTLLSHKVSVPTAQFEQGTRPGRAGTVTCQRQD